MSIRVQNSLTVVSVSLSLGVFASFGCEPRHKTNTPDQAMAGATTVATTPVTGQPTMYPTTAYPTTTATVPATQPTMYPTATGTTTAPTAPPATTGTGGGWPAPSGNTGGFDPAVLADIARKAAAGLGIALPSGGTPAAPAGNPLDNMLQANATKYAPGFSPATPVGRATLKTGEHAGMNIDMVPGKCYVLLAVGGAGVTQLGLHMLIPATPPNVPVISDTNHGNQPVIGEGKPLCPPVKSSVRVDTVIMQGAGDVAVQVWQK